MVQFQDVLAALQLTSQKVLAKKAGISQPALSQMERSDNLHDKTLEKLSLAMRVQPERLVITGRNTRTGTPGQPDKKLYYVN